MEMFCYQCEQASAGVGCSVGGVCGKHSDTSSLQDLIVYQLKGIGFFLDKIHKAKQRDEEADLFVIEALFTTITNVNFDDERLEEMVRKAYEINERLKKSYLKNNSNAKNLPESALYIPAETDDELISQGKAIGILNGEKNEDLRSLQQLLIYGLKGMAAYADHAYILGKSNAEIFAFFAEALSYLNKSDPSMDELIKLNMRCGEVNIKTMELLDQANTQRFGNPVPTEVETGLKAGPAIIVTGHDLLDLDELLKQTEGKGINIYTHGEMLPAHGYPNLKKYKHLAGHFGTAWQNQQREFENIPAVFLFTTNCIQKPRSNYASKVFTAGLVGWPGIKHVAKRDFTPLIEMAKELKGLPADAIHGKLTTGFGHNAILGVADKVIEAVKSGAIKHFFLVGGCDGSKPGRNYYTEFVEKTPKDTVILTLACGKFRFNHLDLGTIGGIPRLLDIGQCNDAYSAIKIAGALAGAFNCGLNELPLSLILSWYEQKAIVILLSLLHLGIKNIRIGPSLPAFISPNILKFLVENFNLKAIGKAEEDLKEILKK